MRNIRVSCSIEECDDGTFDLLVEVKSLSRSEAEMLGEALKMPVAGVCLEVLNRGDKAKPIHEVIQ